MEEVVIEKSQSEGASLSVLELVEDKIISNSLLTEKATEDITVITDSSSEKENTTSADTSIDLNIEIEKYKATNSLIVLITNDNNSQSYLDNAEDGFTVVTQRKRKDKKEHTNQKTELVRSAPYRKARNGVQNPMI